MVNWFNVSYSCAMRSPCFEGNNIYTRNLEILRFVKNSRFQVLSSPRGVKIISFVELIDSYFRLFKHHVYHVYV